jgi:hypothetical protein
MLAVMGLVSLRVRGDVTSLPPDPGISDRAKTALNEAAFSADIAQRISDEVNKLVLNPSDKGTVAMVRQWLNSEDPPTATHPYQEAYSQALNQTFMSVLAQSNLPVNTRINIGLVIKELKGPKMNLAPTAEKLLADKCPAVVLVGEQAARAILQGAIQNPNFTPEMRDKLLAAIVQGVTANLDGPLAGFIADEGYRAINPKVWTTPAMPSGDNLSALILSNLSLQQSRIEAYRTTGVPANPLSDTYASFLLLSDDVWPVMDKDQQFKAVQFAANLVSLMGQRLTAPGLAAGQAQDLVAALKEEGSWLRQLGEIISDVQLQQIGDQIGKLTMGTPPAAVKSACEAVVPELVQNPQFNSLTSPPTISSGPSSAPTSQPSQ